jgi:hypothetical protein
MLTIDFRNGEMPFLYGGNVVKAHVGRWSEDCPEHQGVVVLSMNDTPLVRDLDSTDIELHTLIHYRDSELLHVPRPKPDGWIQRVSLSLGKAMLESTCVKKIRCSRPECQRYIFVLLLLLFRL